MNLDDMLAKALQNPEFKKEYDTLEVEYAIKSALLQARKEQKLAQEQLSQLTGIERPTLRS